MANCEAMATQLPDCEIVFGDGRDIEVLRENNIYQYDAFLALSDSSETNILACMTAKEFGVPKTIADVENLQFYGLAEYRNGTQQETVGFKPDISDTDRCRR